MNTEDIKKEVLNRIKSIKKYKRIPEKEIIQWIDEIPQNEFEPYTINEEKEEVDRDMILYRKVSDIIDFLSQYKDKDYILEERWWGYEDNYFLFTVDRQETSDEIVARICSKVESNCRAFLETDKQIAEIDKEIRRLQNKKSELMK